MFSQKADNRIHALLAKRDFFTLQKEYPRLKKSASKEGLSYMKFYLNSYFNNYEEAMKDVELVAKNEFSWASGEEQLEVAHLIADNSAKMQDYANAAFVYEQLVEQLSPYWDSNALKPYQEIALLYNILGKSSLNFCAGIMIRPPIILRGNNGFLFSSSYNNDFEIPKT